MAKIKFKAYDKTNKRILEPNSCFVQINPAGIFYIKDMNEKYLGCENEFDLMQFTGLHDKNGKEIYEADIVRFADFSEQYSEEDEIRFINREVSFFGGSFGVEGISDLYEICYAGCEVIGNIYENKNLLEV